MLISVSDKLEGYNIIEHKDVVIGIGNSAFDGETYRGVAIKKASDMAQNLGANAIVNLRIDIHQVGDSCEATAYGNAVFVELTNKSVMQAKSQKANLESFIPKPQTEIIEQGNIIDMNGYKFVVCPKCKSKYKADVDSDGHINIKGVEDINDKAPGIQVSCVRCGSKFIVPDKI